jgi:hypothetical protein
MGNKMKISKEVRKNIKSTMKKSIAFPKEKMHDLAEKNAEGMKKHHRMKNTKHSKEDLHEAHKHMKKHAG